MRLNPEKVRNILGVTNHSLKYWRRLPPSHPLHLPAIPDDTNPNLVWYDEAEVHAFIARNERYRNRALAAAAPDEDKEAFAPPPPPATVEWWTNLHQGTQQ